MRNNTPTHEYSIVLRLHSSNYRQTYFKDLLKRRLGRIERYKNGVTDTNDVYYGFGNPKEAKDFKKELLNGGIIDRDGKK